MLYLNSDALFVDVLGLVPLFKNISGLGLVDFDLGGPKFAQSFLNGCTGFQSICPPMFVTAFVVEPKVDAVGGILPGKRERYIAGFFSLTLNIVVA